MKTMSLAVASTVNNPLPWKYILASSVGQVPGGSNVVPSPHYVVVPLVDYVSPTSDPKTLAFVDTDPALGTVGGTVIIGLPSAGSLGDATSIGLYWYNRTCSTVLGKTTCSGVEVAITTSLTLSSGKLVGACNRVGCVHDVT